jgi:succinoglycan biosynthesis transport protein ExoP
MDNTSRLSLNSLYIAVKRRWRVALSVTVLLFAAGGTCVLMLEKKYTATATVLLAPGADQLAGQPTTLAAPMTDPFFVRSETDIASGDALSRAVIQQLQLWTVADFLPRKSLRDWLGLPPKKNDSGLSEQEILVDNVLKVYADRLSVANDGRSNTLAISFTASNSRMAADIANAHAESYLREQSTRGLALQQKAIDWLRREVDARALDVRNADAQVQQYQLKNGIVSTNDSTVVEQRLGQLNTQLVDARRQLSTQTALLDEVRKIRRGGDAGSAASMLGDTPLNDLLQTRAETEASIASSAKRFAPNHPTFVKQRQDLAGINDALNQHLGLLESEASSSARWWQKQVDELETAVNAETTRKVDQDRVSVGLPSLMSQAQVRRTVFETVLNRYETLLAEQAFAAPTASIVERAEPSSRPSSPKVPLFLVVAAMLSMLAGTGTAAVLEMRTGTSMGLAAMADAVGIRPLVAIPRFRDASRGEGAVQIMDPRLFVESIRFLREAVLAGWEEGQGRICLVTSVLPRQGKSLVAMSLARGIARANRRALFLELDLRRPTGSLLARRVPPGTGIAAVLEGRASITDAVVKDANPKLDLLLAEENASSALDHLTSASLGELLADLRSRYDAIIIDSPPLGIVSDALTLTPLVDQILLVAKDVDSSLTELRRGTRLLQERGAVVPGLVLTSVDPNHLSSVDKETLHRYVMGVPESGFTDPGRDLVRTDARARRAVSL